MELLVEVASETLRAFEQIADAATRLLGERTSGVDAFATMNAMTAGRALENLGRVQSELAAAYRRLQDEPAIARIVVLDENDKREVLYICRATTVECDVQLCSSLGPKGRLASLPVGDFAPIRLPSGIMNYDVVEKAILKPTYLSSSWDARNTVFNAVGLGPLTIASLRDLLVQAGFPDDQIDVLERLLAEENEATNVVEGLKRSVLTAMQLRDQPILDKFQDEIFRLPLDSRLVILGPPGTGKTTTLVRRLRQKIDAAFLDDDELASTETPVGGLPHQQSWMMFTPTELLKQYVREAFAREGVPAPEQRIRTWSDHRRDLARRSLPILRSASGGTLVLHDRDDALQQSTVLDQIAWFDDFDAYQTGTFIADLTVNARVLEGAGDAAAARAGARLVPLLTGSAGRPVAAMSAIAPIFDDLRRIASDLGDGIQAPLRQTLNQHLRRDPGLLDDLAKFIAAFAADIEDDPEDVDDGDDEEAATPPQGRKAAQLAFIRALRAQAVAEARKRPIPRAGRNSRVLEWLRDRGVSLPDLKTIGDLVVVQRAARKITSSPNAFVRAVPTRYRAFRRERRGDGKWYAEGVVTGRAITPLEVDVVLLAMLRNSRAVSNDAAFMRRLGDRAPRILDDVSRLQRNQILVDEATDFSPIQLACMAALTNSKTESFFACGDFNQRLTVWGSRSVAHMRWIYPNLEVREIDVAYRQSRKLNELASLLTSTDTETKTRLPDHLDNEGVPPVLGLGLADVPSLVRWLAERIAEIETFAGQLPSIAVLVNEREMVHPLAEELNEALADMNIRAVPCPDGQVMGQGNDVRVFEVEHIKGLEFEAVFFVDVEKLERREPELFDKYLYVGATRAATYLGVTCLGTEAPAALDRVRHLFEERW